MYQWPPCMQTRGVSLAALCTPKSNTPKKAASGKKAVTTS